MVLRMLGILCPYPCLLCLLTGLTVLIEEISVENNHKLNQHHQYKRKMKKICKATQSHNTVLNRLPSQILIRSFHQLAHHSCTRTFLPKEWMSKLTHRRVILRLNLVKKKMSMHYNWIVWKQNLTWN